MIDIAAGSMCQLVHVAKEPDLWSKSTIDTCLIFRRKGFDSKISNQENFFLFFIFFISQCYSLKLVLDMVVISYLYLIDSYKQCIIISNDHQDIMVKLKYLIRFPKDNISPNT